MTISYAGHRGNAQEKTSDTSLAVTISGANISAGALVIVRAATDNSSTTSGETTDHSLSDSQSNTWTKIVERTYSPTSTAGDGTTTSLWYSILTTGLTSGSDTITLTLSTAVTAKTLGVEEFSGTSLTFANKASVGQTTDPRDVTLSGLTSREYLWIAMTGLEGTGLFSSEDPDYTPFATNVIQTSDGLAASNMMQCGAYRIFTGTSDTRTVDMTASRDGVDILAAFYEGSGDQTISAAGAIASAEGFGSDLINLSMLPTAIASAEGFGSDLINLSMLPTAIASGEAFGSPQLNFILLFSGLESAEAVGIPQIGLQLILPLGIGSGEALGTPQFNFTLAVSGIASLEAVGSLTLGLYLQPGGIASVEAFGTAALHLIVLPSGLSSAEAFGNAAFLIYITPTGLPSEEGFGSPIVTLAGGAQSIVPGGIAGAEAFGTTLLNLNLNAIGLASLEAFGTAFIQFYLVPVGIATTAAVGNPNLHFSLLLAGMASTEAFGAAQFRLYISVPGIDTAELFGVPQITFLTAVVPFVELHVHGGGLSSKISTTRSSGLLITANPNELTRRDE